MTPKHISRHLSEKVFLLILELTVLAFFAIITPAMAGTGFYSDLTHFSGIFSPGTPGQTWTSSEHFSLFQNDPGRRKDFAEGRRPFRYRISNANSESGNASVVSREPFGEKSYLIPGLEIVGLIAAVNGIARVAMKDGDTYDSNFSTFWNNLIHGDWIADNDNFSTNQLRHPYLGASFHGFARSAGLDFFESMGYTFVGSFLWETAGETDQPSPNDQVASGIAGSFLGEPLFRMANLLLDSSKPGFWRELGAALISPPTGFNRLVFSKRFDAVFPSRKPAFFWRLDLGANVIAHRSGADTGDLQQGGTIAGFSMEYGLPGKPGYHYTRPFDYFQIEASAATNYSSKLGALSTRGLLLGREYRAGDSYQGVWGLYGTYDYIASDPARVSSTAVSIGTTAQWRLSPCIALQGTVLGGIGYGAGGEISGSPERNYHYGGTAQGIFDLRLILGDFAMLDFRGRQYCISDVAATAPQGSETIRRLGLGFTIRIYDRHAISLRYHFSNRDTDYVGIENRHQEVGAISLAYTFLSGDGFGAVESSYPLP